MELQVHYIWITLNFRYSLTSQHGSHCISITPWIMHLELGISAIMEIPKKKNSNIVLTILWGCFADVSIWSDMETLVTVVRYGDTWSITSNEDPASCFDEGESWISWNKFQQEEKIVLMVNECKHRNSNVIFVLQHLRPVILWELQLDTVASVDSEPWHSSCTQTATTEKAGKKQSTSFI